MSKYEKLCRKTLVENNDVDINELALMNEAKIEAEFDKKYAFVVIEPINKNNRHLYHKRQVLAIPKSDLEKYGEPIEIEDWV